METRLTYNNRLTLVEIAQLIVSPAFPELKGRAIAVTGVDDDPESAKSIEFPFALIGLRIGDTSGPSVLGANSTINLRDNFIVEFNMKKERYKTQKGAETSLFSYYDYEVIRDRLFNAMVNFAGEYGITFEFVALDISTEGDSVYIEFQFRQIYEWCEAEREGDTVIEAGSFSLNIKGC